MYVVNYDFQPAQKKLTPYDAKPTTQLTALLAQMLARQQARNPAGKHAPCATDLTLRRVVTRHIDRSRFCVRRGGKIAAVHGLPRDRTGS